MKKLTAVFAFALLVAPGAARAADGGDADLEIGIDAPLDAALDVTIDAPDTAVADTVDAAPETTADTAIEDTFEAATPEDTFVADTFVADTFVADTFVADSKADSAADTRVAADTTPGPIVNIISENGWNPRTREPPEDQASCAYGRAPNMSVAFGMTSLLLLGVLLRRRR